MLEGLILVGLAIGGLLWYESGKKEAQNAQVQAAQSIAQTLKTLSVEMTQIQEDPMSSTTVLEGDYVPFDGAVSAWDELLLLHGEGFDVYTSPKSMLAIHGGFAGVTPQGFTPLLLASDPTPNF